MFCDWMLFGLFFAAAVVRAALDGGQRFCFSTWSICCLMMGSRFRWIILQCNFYCTQKSSFGGIFSSVRVGKNHLGIVRICCSNIYFSYCIVARRAIVKSGAGIFMSQAYSRDFFVRIWNCNAYCMCSLFGSRFLLTVHGRTRRWSIVSLDVNGSGRLKLIFHYKIFMKWVCLHPSMGL